MSSFEEPIVGYSSSDIDSENHSENIFQKLPDELIGVIFEYLTSVELIFSVAKVCKYWSNEVVFPIMKEQYKTFIAEIYHHNKEEENEFKILSMIDFYSKRQGQRFVKHMLRKCVFNYAAQLQKHIHHVNNDDRVVECNPSWLDNDLSILKHYFLHFSDVREGTLFKPFNSNNSNVTTQTTNTSGGGIFKGVLDYMASLFGGNKSNSTVSSNSTSNTTTNKQSNEKIVFR
ncbi:hypothetical protein C9374_003954 [Naegleria lovaniensis]|uniref:F-box domain-containing protein n=1 Tax=Naegleria lovaniensis TaxID=51637 RepID=A0AA88H076_NAELO|nr:uncharacterized protein C9374_003954 [Naegleria lovaniensis]KAG2394190.1 hypothetical protein C9374_003954 [Naegleria lovaniensis]